MTDIFLPPELTGHIYGLDAGALRLRGEATSSAIEAALIGSDWSRVLRIPAGFNTIDGQNRVWATVISRPIVMTGRSIFGSIQISNVASRIIPAVAMPALVLGTNCFGLQDIQLDGKGLAARGLDGLEAHDADIRRIQIFNCTDWGLHLKDSYSRVRQVYIAGNAKGARLIGCTAMTLDDAVINANVGHGLEMVGISSGLTGYAGGVHMKNGTIDGNGRDGTSPQAILDGVEGGSMRDVYIEGGAGCGPNGILMQRKCHSLTASGLHFVVAGYAVDAQSARGCVFRDCTQPIGPGNVTPKVRVVRDGPVGLDAGHEMHFINCYADSYNDPRPWNVEHWLNGNPVWAYEARGDGAYASGPPPGTLRFRTGTRVRNKTGPGGWAQTTWNADSGFLWVAD